MSDLQFAPNGLTLASASYTGPAKLWNVATGEFVRSFSLSQDHVHTLAFSPDGLALALGGADRRFAVHRVADGVVLVSRDQADIRKVRYTPDGSLIALTRLYTTATLIDTTNYTGQGWLGSDDDPPLRSWLSISPDSKLIAFSTWEGTATIYRLPDRGVVTNFFCATMPNPTNDDYEIQVDTNCVPPQGELAFSPDGRLLALTRRDGRTELRNVANHWAVERIIEQGGEFLSFTPDSQVLGLVSSRYLRFFRVRDAQLVAAYDFESGGVTALAFSPDGKHFAYGRGDGAVVLARMPVILEPPARQGGQLHLQWRAPEGGPFQVQQRTNLVTGEWQNVNGPSTNTSFTAPLTNPAAFFRVQSLTNAP